MTAVEEIQRHSLFKARADFVLLVLVLFIVVAVAVLVLRARGSGARGGSVGVMRAE